MATGLPAVAADAHDAGVLGAHFARVPQADASDAGVLGHLARVPPADCRVPQLMQLMLMMLVSRGAFGKGSLADAADLARVPPADCKVPQLMQLTFGKGSRKLMQLMLVFWAIWRGFPQLIAGCLS